MKKFEYKRMLLNCLERLLCEMNGGRIEDHHACADIVSILDCDEEFARKMLSKIKLVNPNLIVDTE